MTATASETFVHLPADSNQALGIGQFAIDFLEGALGDGPSDAVKHRTELFHTDSVFCGLSALALRTNAPHVLRDEALTYPTGAGEKGATPFGSTTRVKSEKAILANSNAVREWDSQRHELRLRRAPRQHRGRVRPQRLLPRRRRRLPGARPRRHRRPARDDPLR